MNTLMQIVFIPQTELFCRYVEKMQDEISEVVLKLMNPLKRDLGTQNGGSKLNRPSKAKEQRICLKKKILEAQISYFDQEMKAYVGAAS